MSDQFQTAHPHGGTRWRTLLIVLVLLVIVGSSLWFWRDSRNQGQPYTPPGAIDVVAMTVRAETAPVTLDALGEIRAVNQVMLVAEAPGRITAINFESGQSVAQGDVLVQLDDSTEQAQLASARASEDFARDEWRRASELVGGGATSEAELQQRKTELDQATAQVQQLETLIRKLRIEAPFAGDLGLRQVDPGQYLNVGTGIVSLSDLSSLYVNFDIPQQQLARLAIGQSVEVRSDTPGASPVTGQVSAIEPQIDRDARTVTVQAELANDQRLLYPGMYVTVAVSLPPENNALMVPVTAIITSASGDAAAVVRNQEADGTGVAEIIPVTTGRRVGDNVLITEGLSDGDVIITEGQLRVQPGAAVRVVGEG